MDPPSGRAFTIIIIIVYTIFEENERYSWRANSEQTLNLTI